MPTHEFSSFLPFQFPPWSCWWGSEQMTARGWELDGVKPQQSENFLILSLLCKTHQKHMQGCHLWSSVLLFHNTVDIYFSELFWTSQNGRVTLFATTSMSLKNFLIITIMGKIIHSPLHTSDRVKFLICFCAFLR